jgi:hypothetical protein
MPVPEERDPPPCMLIFALGIMLWIIILFGITYVIYWLVA